MLPILLFCIVVSYPAVVDGDPDTDVAEGESWTIEKQLLKLRATVAEQNTKICELEKGLTAVALELSKWESTTTPSVVPTTTSGELPTTTSGELPTTTSGGVPTRTPGGVTGGKGVTFVRWGRKVCPSQTQIVYLGFAGGSHYTHSGGAADYLCLPDKPVWGPHKDIARGSNGYVYGAEYENPLVSGFQNHDVPCVVCLATSHTTTMMIPGRNICYPGWTLAYKGDLSSGYYDHKAASQYVCLDENIESVLGGVSNANGKLFYPVRVRCGSLPCPPYINDKNLSCAVCLK